MVSLLIIALALHISGIKTITWWTFEAQGSSLTAQGDTLQLKQYISMSLEGIILKNEFCEFGTCHESLSQTRQPSTKERTADPRSILDFSVPLLYLFINHSFVRIINRFYDDTRNPRSIRWTQIRQSKHYVGPADEARHASEDFTALNEAAIVFFFCSMLAMVARTFTHPLCKWPRFVYWITCSTHTLAILMVGLSLVVLNEKFASMRTVLRDEPLISPVSKTDEPELKWGYSFHLTLCSVMFYIAALYPLWHSFPVDPDADVTVQKQRAREKRLSSYFFDVSNTSYMTEAHPIDNTSQVTKHGVKIKGWTEKVQSVKVNNFTVAPGGGTRQSAAPAETVDLEAGEGPVEMEKFSGTLEWRQPKMGKKKTTRRSTTTETTHGPSPPGESPGKKAAAKKPRRATMSDLPTMGGLPGGIDDLPGDRPATAGGATAAELMVQHDLIHEAASANDGAPRPRTQGRVSLSKIAARPVVLEERKRKVGRVPRRHSLKLEGPDNNPRSNHDDPDGEAPGGGYASYGFSG